MEAYTETAAVYVPCIITYTCQNVLGMIFFLNGYPLLLRLVLLLLRRQIEAGAAWTCVHYTAATLPSSEGRAVDRGGETAGLEMGIFPNQIVTRQHGLDRIRVYQLLDPFKHCIA